MRNLVTLVVGAVAVAAVVLTLVVMRANGELTARVDKLETERMHLSVFLEYVEKESTKFEAMRDSIVEIETRLKMPIKAPN